MFLSLDVTRKRAKQRKPTSPRKKKKREIKHNEPGIVMSGEETEGQQNDHQKRDGNDELRENCKEMQPPLKPSRLISK